MNMDKVEISNPELIDKPRPHSPDDKVQINFTGTIGLRNKIARTASSCGMASSTWMIKMLSDLVDGKTVGQQSDIAPDVQAYEAEKAELLRSKESLEKDLSAERQNSSELIDKVSDLQKEKEFLMNLNKKLTEKVKELESLNSDNVVNIQAKAEQLAIEVPIILKVRVDHV